MNFLSQQDLERTLDAVEVSFHYIDQRVRRYAFEVRSHGTLMADSAIKELNRRFKEHGVGYQFINGEIMQIDSEFIHSEAVKPALTLLNLGGYAGAEEEFLKAHEHYRRGKAKEAVNSCLKAFESVMKSICSKRAWTHNNSPTSKKLLAACFDNGLMPTFWQQNFASLRSLLESSVPTGRNKLGAYGQGTSSTAAPDHLVAYMLHMTASAIVFLCEAEASLP